MSRRKQPSVYVLETNEEARQMIAEYTQLERDRLLEELLADEAIAKIKEQRSAALAEMEAQRVPLFASLKAWWEAGACHDYAPGRRTGEVGSAKLGHRLNTPSLKTERKVTFKAVLEWLGTLRWSRKKEFLRTKVELDKEAIIKAMRDDEKVAETFAGRLRIEQLDEFFIDTGLTAETVKKDVAL